MVPIMVEGAETLSKVLMDAAATSMPVDVTKYERFLHLSQYPLLLYPDILLCFL